MLFFEDVEFRHLQTICKSDNDFHLIINKKQVKRRTMVETIYITSLVDFAFIWVFFLPPKIEKYVCASQIGSSLQGSGRQFVVLL